MTKLPDWVSKHKGPGIAIEKRGNSYYASRVTSVWNPEKKRAQKKTLEYLGKVTPEGIVPPRQKRSPKIGGVLEAGNFMYIERFAQSLSGPLAEFFPDDWQSILAAAAIKLCYKEPLSRMRLRHETSFSKRLWPKAALSKNSLSLLLPRIGHQWPAQRDFFARMSREEKHVAIDLSHIFSESKNIPWIEYGHNGDGLWRPQLQILLMWGTTTHRPGFLKLLPGATHSARCLANAVWESGLQDLIAVADKGSWRPGNITYLEDAGVQYAIPLRRNLPLVQKLPQSRYKDFFHYRKRAQWWCATEWEGRKIYHYLDKSMADREESAYLELYKERREVEYAFDALQNTLGADVTWMRTREAMQGYLLIFFVALHLYSQILNHMKRKQLLKRFSVQDVLTHLSKVSVVEVNGQDRIGEVTRQTKRMIELLEVPITERPGL